MIEARVYEKHRNLKLAAMELGIKWQTLYSRLKSAGIPVVGDKLRYGTDRDRLGALAEHEFKRLVPAAIAENDRQFQSKFDFMAGGQKIDVKASRPRQLNKRHPTLSWSFSFKRQTLICDFMCCFCYAEDGTLARVLLVPREFFSGLQTVSVACSGGSKWLDYSIEPSDLAEFFYSLSQPREAYALGSRLEAT